MAYMVIPTEFTAVGNYTEKVGMMSSVTAVFGERVASAGRQMLAYGEAALVFGGIFETGKSILDYGTEIANLSAVTGATGAKLDQFKGQIESVAYATKKSSVDVAQSFTNVDNNMPQYHDNIAALTEVTTASINLAKAGRMELGPAAESLTLSMNQFGHGAKDAARDIDALASGAVAGSSRISETSEALQVFGSVAANVAHVTYAESVALVELGSKFEKGREAGTRYRNILLDMTNVKFGPAADLVKNLGVNLDKVANTNLPFIDRFEEISKIKDNPEAMEKMFGKRNVAMASGLFSVIENYEKIAEATSKVGTAEEMAAVNTNTLAESFVQLKNNFITHVTTSDKVSLATDGIKNSVQFLGNHLDGLLNIVEVAGGAFLIYKGAIIASTAATYAYEFAAGVASVATWFFTESIFDSTAAMKGMAATAYVMDMGLWSVLGVVGLAAAAIAVLTLNVNDDWEKQKQLADSLDKTKDGFKQVRPAINGATIAMHKYNEEMDNYNAIKDFNARSEYAYKQGMATGVATSIYNAVAHPWLSAEASGDVEGNNPGKAEDFLKDRGYDMKDVQRTPDDIQREKAQAQRDTAINVNVNLSAPAGCQVQSSSFKFAHQ